MTAYYNEIDPYAAQWLRNLIRDGLIADGLVDERSIVDVRPGDLAGFLQCHFFAGLGGWSGALRLAGIADDEPIWTGSCPCQPFSLAGSQKGFDDARHLWPIWKKLIGKCRPAIVLGEQVASAAQWLRLVRGDLEAMGYAVGCIPIEAASAGADHLRDRFWFVADGSSTGLPQRAGNRSIHHETLEPSSWQDPVDARDMGNPGSAGGRRHGGTVPGTEAKGEDRRQITGNIADELESTGVDWVIGADGKARRVKPGIRLLAHGVPQRVAKLRALGNAIDLRPAAEFIKAAVMA